MATKYQPIADHLATVTGASITLTLTEIEALIGGPLAVTACTNPSYWTAPKSALGRALSRQGWRSRLDVRNRCVIFMRAEVTR